MIVFNTFLRMIWKNKWVMLIYVVLFLGISFLTANANQQNSDTNFQHSSVNYNIVVTEPSPLSDTLIEFLSRDNRVDVVTDSEEELREKVFTGEITIGLILPANLEESVLTKQSNIITITNDQAIKSNIALTSLESFFTFAQALLADHAFTKEKLLSVMEEHATVTILNQQQTSSALLVDRSWSMSYFNFLTFILLMLFISVLGLTFSQFQEKNVFARQVISPLSSFQMNLQKFGGLLVTGTLITVFFIVGLFILKPTILHSDILPAQIFLTLVFMLCALAMTFLIVILVGNKKFLYSGLSNLVGLSLAGISGVMLPAEFLSPSVIAVSKFFPVYYFVEANQKLFDGNYAIGINVMIICLFTIFYFSLALAIGKMVGSRKHAT